MTPKEFSIIADEYNAKLSEIAKKNGLSYFSSNVVTDPNTLDNVWYKSIVWKNMNENEVMKSCAIVTQECCNVFIEDLNG